LYDALVYSTSHPIVAWLGTAPRPLGLQPSVHFYSNSQAIGEFLFFRGKSPNDHGG